MFLTPLRSTLLRHSLRNSPRLLHSTATLRDSPTHFTNILAGANVPATQVKSVTPEGIHLEDGRIVPGPCIFLEGQVFLWNVPSTLWDGWKPEHFEVFDAVVPKPGALCVKERESPSVYWTCVELLLFGTGQRVTLPPPSIRQHLSKLGLNADFMDTVCHHLAL